MGGSNHSPLDSSQQNEGIGVTRESNDSKGSYFSEDEEMLIARMFRLVGQRWSLIAGRIPGRSAEEIEKYWTLKYSSSSGSER